MKQNKGFTLIELLIVVAIIAILAAIAVPNFLEAQTRAKVSRAKSDLRTLATGIEAYAVDHNKPPREYDSRVAVDGPLEGQTNPSGIMSKVLSTPIAYLTTAYMADPFVSAQNRVIPADEKYFTYASADERRNSSGAQWFFNGAGGNAGMQQSIEDYYGSWYTMSIGPDKSFFNNGTNARVRPAGTGPEYICYDPTNGTVSLGNILRSQKRSDSAQPPADGKIIGAH